MPFSVVIRMNCANILLRLLYMLKHISIDSIFVFEELLSFMVRITSATLCSIPVQAVDKRRSYVECVVVTALIGPFL